MSEYGLILWKPNKRFQIKQVVREEILFEYLKNAPTVCMLYINNFLIDPSIINGDQLTLQRNESASQKTK